MPSVSPLSLTPPALEHAPAAVRSRGQLHKASESGPEKQYPAPTEKALLALDSEIQLGQWQVTFILCLSSLVISMVLFSLFVRD